jgi:drug/metabolite transporter (DMT)-like permease
VERRVTAGIVFAILAAATFAFNGASIRRAVATASASQGLYVTIFVGLGLFIALSLLTGQIFDAGDIAARDYGFLVAGGFIHILAGRYCNYRAIAALGSNRSAPIVGLSTLAAVIIAMIFLEESVSAVNGAGIALIMVGPALVKPKRETLRVPAGASDTASRGAASAVVAHTPRVAEGYFFGFAAAALWGVGPVLMRAGLDTTELGVWAGTIAYATAAVVLLPTLLIPGQARGALTLDKGARLWFLVGAFNSFLANVFRYTALALAPVSVVVPLMRIAILFQIGFNYFINRTLESFEPRVIGGILISLAGALLLVI